MPLRPQALGFRVAFFMLGAATELIRKDTHTMGDEVVVRCKELRKTYEGTVEAVRGLDLTIYGGQCYGLLGPNGAGKTTTIEILEGLLEASSGTVEILGRTWREHAAELREAIGVSLQETRLSEKLTVRETIELFGGFYRKTRPVEDVLEELALTEKADAWVGKLSGGQKQRLAIATALVGDPRILFLDEPTTGLDPQSRRQVWEIVRRFQSNGGTVLLTTHYMDEAERLCDYISIIDHGKVIAAGSPAELISGVGGHHRVEFALLNAPEVSPERWMQLPGVGGVTSEDGVTALTVEEPHATIPALLALIEEQGWRLSQLTTRQSSLEDVFVTMTGRHLREE
jgi:ABC-2 type transport system ATP-binding protein